MKRFPLFLFFLLCSCVTSKRVKEYLAKQEKEPEAKVIVAEWLEQHKAWYAEKAAKDFPVTAPVAPGPAPHKNEAKEPLLPVPPQLDATPVPKPIKERPARRLYTPKAIPPPILAPLFKTDPAQEQALQESKDKLAAARAALQQEKTGHEATRQQLHETEAERDYWEDKNRKKFWALVVMAIFAVLYVVFRELGDRVRET